MKRLSPKTKRTIVLVVVIILVLALILGPLVGLILA